MRQLLRDLFDIARDASVRLWLGLLNRLPGRPGNRLMDPLRRHMLKLLRIDVGPKSQVSPGFLVFAPGNVRFGHGCRIGYHFQIWNHAPLQVGDRLLASHNISIVCGTHRTDIERTNVSGPVTIGDDVWIGANVLIVGPAEIGNGAIIGANSFVTGHVPAGACFGGSPAKALQLRAKVEPRAMTRPTPSSQVKHD